MSNDTGSNFLTVSQLKVYWLGYNPWVHWTSPIIISTANGIVCRQAIRLIIQILDCSGNGITEWFYEYAIIVPSLGASPRLSGNEMRKQLYFATAPRDITHFHVLRAKTHLFRRLLVLVSHNHYFQESILNCIVISWWNNFRFVPLRREDITICSC